MKINTHKILLTLIPVLAFSCAFSQPAKNRMTREQYIETYKYAALKDMIKSGVPASITLAQGLLESENGNSELAVNALNHFGIKCHKEWNGPVYHMDDDQKNECFRKYNEVLESYDDHSAFLRSRSRYSFLFDLARTDYKGWAEGLKKAGYATNPNYPQLLIKIIEENKLYELDRQDKIPTPNVQANPDPAVQYVKITHTSGKILFSKNNVKYIIAEEGDTYMKIASRYQMGLWQIYKYNELDKKSTIKKGQRIYLQPKKRKATVEFHTVKAGETMYSISQDHAVKMKHLYRKNRMKPGTEPQPGQKLWLKKKMKAG